MSTPLSSHSTTPVRPVMVHSHDHVPPFGGSANDLLNVVHVINGEHFSGAERVQLHLAHRLPETGFVSDFVCIKPNAFPEHFDAPVGMLQNLPMRNRFSFSVAYQVARFAKHRHAKLLHAHTPRSAMIASIASRIAKLPWVYHVHSPAARDSTRPWLNRFNYWAERLSLKNCVHQITVSNSLRREVLRTGWFENRVTVVHNGVPAATLVRTTREPNDGTWTLGMIALMRPRKGLETLLDALRCVLNAGLPVRLRCIGSFETESYQRSIMARVDQLKLRDAIDFTGFTRDIAGELMRLDALVLPSLFGEGLPMVVLEAMAAGVPVIATSVEGTPEAIRHNVEGLLAEPGSPGSLAAQIAGLVQGDFHWEDLSHAANKRHAECFSDRAMAQGVAEVYRRVLKLHSAVNL